LQDGAEADGFRISAWSGGPDEMSTATLISVEEFSAMPRDEAVRYELVEGELVPLASGTPRHAWIRDGLIVQFRDYLRVQRSGIVLSELDCRTTGENVRRPDVSYVSRERWQLVNPSVIPLPFAPDIAIEILSPSEKAVEVNRKVAEYLAAGSSEVWVIDAENSEVFVRSVEDVRVLRAGEAVESRLLPGFSFGVSEGLAGPVV
jgi:Uma2 family endonuclease